MTLAQLPGADGCLSPSEEDPGCTPVREPFYYPEDFVVSGDGRHAYLLSWGYGPPTTVHVFTRDRLTGALTEDHCISTGARSGCRTEPLLEDAGSLTISPDRRNVYISGAPTPEDGNDETGMGWPSPDRSAIVVFARNAATGELTRIQCLTAGETTGCEHVDELGGPPTVSPDGRHVYVGTLILDRDPSTGRLSGPRCTYGLRTDEGCPAGWFDAMAPDGRFAYARTASMRITTYARDPASGELTEVACPGEDDCRPSGRGPFGGFAALTVAPDGRNLYAVSWYPDVNAWVFDMDVDPGTGLITQRACFNTGEADSECTPVAALVNPAVLAAAPDGQALYVPSGGNWAGEGGITMFARDPATGRLAWAGCVTQDGSDGACVQGSALETANQVAVSPDSRNVYVLNGGAIAVLGLAVDVVAEELRVSHRAIRPQLVCPTGVEGCDGKVSFKRSRLTVATKRFSVPGGSETRIRVKLSERGLKKLRRRGHLKTTATVTSSSLPGRTVRSMKLERR